jgi:DNA end-binding protein Ku
MLSLFLKKRVMMKSIWSGSLFFGLLNIPVNVYSAITEHKFGFRVLCGKCHTPLKNVRWCEHCKKAVAWDDTVKGFKKDKNSFFVMTHEEINKLKPEKMDRIEIKEFVHKDEIEILYIENHYYLMPEKKDDKAFYLFAQALEKANKVAIAQFVMREKEYVAAISFYKNMLLLNTLHYNYEIREIQAETSKKIKTSKEELDLALLLINKLTHKKFDLSKYKDTFVEKLKKALKSPHKKTSKKTTAKEESKKKKTTKEKTLTSSLKESLREVRA